MSLRYALLGLLANHPASGYELTKEFELSLVNVWSAKHSQIYPELQRMANDGWIEVGEEGSRGRKEYRITSKGSNELRKWIFQKEPKHNIRNETLLRVFSLWTLSNEEAAGHFEKMAKNYQEIVKALKEIDGSVEWDASKSDLMGRIALKYGILCQQLAVEWAVWAAEQIRAGHDATTLSDWKSEPGPYDSLKPKTNLTKRRNLGGS